MMQVAVKTPPSPKKINGQICLKSQCSCNFKQVSMFSLHYAFLLRHMDTRGFMDESIVFIKLHHLIRDEFTTTFTPISLDTFPMLCIDHVGKYYEAMTSIRLTQPPYITKCIRSKQAKVFIKLSEKGILVCFDFTHESQCSLFSKLPIESMCYNLLLDACLNLLCQISELTLTTISATLLSDPSKRYKPFSYLPIPINFLDCKSCIRKKSRKKVTKQFKFLVILLTDTKLHLKLGIYKT